MRGFLLGVVTATVLTAALSWAVFTPKGITTFTLVGVEGTVSPTADSRDRALLQFTDPDGNNLVVIFKDTTRALAVVTAASGATIATTSTTTTTTTTTTTAAPTTTTT